VTTAQRSPALPDVPTVVEAGLSGSDTSVWWGLLGPAGMSPDLVDKLYKDFTAAVRDPGVQARIEKPGRDHVRHHPAGVRGLDPRPGGQWEPVIRAANIGAQ
jgi:tripartite-type tricarboxylate transporter receptor subunit TctC